MKKCNLKKRLTHLHLRFYILTNVLNLLIIFEGGAYPYHFGTGDKYCVRRKRRTPWRGVWEITHRYLYYRGYYFDFLGKYKTLQNLTFIIRTRTSFFFCTCFGFFFLIINILNDFLTLPLYGLP